MLTIENLHASVDNVEILKGINLTVKPGEVHAIMGPNGSGKSTLSGVLAGKEDYTVSAGQALFNDQNILALEPEERAQLGLFLAFQYPVEIPGVSNSQFLKTAINSIRKAKGLSELDAFDFLSAMKSKMQAVGMSEKFLTRAVNEGFSGGEKKRNEVLQMLMLEPELIILDETDSGLDIDALQTVADGVNTLRNDQRSFIVITHYQRLLNYIVPDYIHVLSDGKIVRSGDKTLAEELEAQGYGWLTKETAA